jgi:hypothetical protein
MGGQCMPLCHCPIIVNNDCTGLRFSFCAMDVGPGVSCGLRRIDEIKIDNPYFQDINPFYR